MPLKSIAAYRNLSYRKVMQGFAALILCWPTTALAAKVDYTSFQSQTYSLELWQGSHVAVLTQSSSLDTGTMNSIVNSLDSAWNVYADLTGRTPTPLFAINGRGTIAEVPDGSTCGAGCGFLGFSGIEIAAPYWDILYNGVHDNGQYDQVLFYELGRNFWFYEDQLGITTSFTTGFAIANRFVSMERAGITGGPYFEFTFDQFKQKATVDLIAAYRANPNLNWTNTLALNTGVPGNRFSGGPDIAGAFIYQLYLDYGYDKYKAFWRELAKQPKSSSAADAVHAYERAALAATGNSYSDLFDNTPPSSGSSTVLFLGTDTSTQGNWTGKYGNGGYVIANSDATPFNQATIGFSEYIPFTWSGSWGPVNADPRVLQTAPGASTRIATALTNYVGKSFSINLNVYGDTPHLVALYLLDWDTSTRSETVTITDASTGRLYDKQTFSGFHNGIYALWTLRGNLTIQVTPNSGPSAVVSGVFIN